MPLATHAPTAAFVLLLGIALGGCAAAEEPPAPETSEEAPPAAEEDPNAIASLDELGGTAWGGRDKTYNDIITIEFFEDGTVGYRSGGEAFKTEGDSWTASGDTVDFSVDFGGGWGIATYTGTFNAEEQVISATYTTTTNRAGEIDLKPKAD